MKLRQTCISILLFLALCAGLFSSIPNVAAQSAGPRLQINLIQNQDFPKLSIGLTVSNPNGLPITKLTSADFTLSEDGARVDKFDFTAGKNDKQPVSIVIVLDTSNTMTEPVATITPPLQQSVNAAKELIKTLASQDSVAIITFDEKVTVLQELTGDKAGAAKKLDNLLTKGPTLMHEGLNKGVELLQTRPERRFLILFTDGRHNTSVLPLDQVLDAATRYAVPIVPVVFGYVDKTPFTRMAQATGTDAIYLPAATALQTALTSQVDTLREAYSFAYTSKLPADGKEHEFLIGLISSGSRFEAKQTFIAKPNEVKITFPGFDPTKPLGGKLSLTPSLVAPAEVVKISVTLDGQPLPDLNVKPFVFEYDFTTLTPGEHTLVFSGLDASANKGETTLKLTVRPPVIVTIDAPAAGATLTGKVKITPRIDSLLKVNQVEIKIDGKSLFTLNAEPFEVEWDTKASGGGTHEITVIATDEAGKTGEAKLDVKVEMQSDYGILGLAAVVVLAAAALIIPMAMRSRKRKMAEMPESFAGGGQSGAGYTSTGASLREMDGMSPGQLWPLNAAEIRLGRKRDENDIPLKGLSASRRHATIRQHGNQYYIASLSGENPVLVNGAAIQQIVLHNGDTVQLGESTFRFEQ